MRIAKNRVATIDYTLTDQSGALIDSTEDEGPLSYLHGSETLVPGFQRALEGHGRGEVVHATVPPELAYGEVQGAMLQTVTRDRLPLDDVRIGMHLSCQSPQGLMVVRVTAIDGDEVTLDANHPLAGRTLHFEATVREVREATSHELERGEALSVPDAWPGSAN